MFLLPFWFDCLDNYLRSIGLLRSSCFVFPACMTRLACLRTCFACLPACVYPQLGLTYRGSYFFCERGVGGLCQHSIQISLGPRFRGNTEPRFLGAPDGKAPSNKFPEEVLRNAKQWNAKQMQSNAKQSNGLQSNQMESNAMQSNAVQANQ